MLSLVKRPRGACRSQVPSAVDSVDIAKRFLTEGDMLARQISVNGYQRHLDGSREIAVNSENIQSLLGACPASAIPQQNSRKSDKLLDE